MQVQINEKPISNRFNTLLLLSTYNMQDRFSFRIKPTITDIQIYNNKIIEERTIHKKLSFLYNKSLLF